MGNSDSSDFQFPPHEDDGLSSRSRQSKKSGEERKSSSSSVETALKVGAAVAGTALLAVGAWNLASSSSSGDSDRQGIAEGIGSSGSRGGSTSSGGYKLSNEYKPYRKHLGDSNQNLALGIIKIMSYNVWFREDVKVQERMKAIGNLVQQHTPDVIFFQEVTPTIYGIFQSSDWWKIYKCSVSPQEATRKYFCMLLTKLPVKVFNRVEFKNSTMGRELCVAEIDVGTGQKLRVATSHFESPTPPMMHSMERIDQARRSLDHLRYSPNVIFGGDMNWDDILDGPFPLLYGWVDAWSELRPGESGWTYDTKSNEMLLSNRPLQKRLDRFICKLQNFKLLKIEMIGMAAIPGLSWYNKKLLPVLPSDHYGLLLTVCLL